MPRFFWVLLIALSISPVCQAGLDTAAIVKFAQEIMHLDRNILICEGALGADQLSVYYSNDYMKRIAKGCDKSENNPYHGEILRKGFLDGESPIFCHDDKNAVAACFKEYIIESIKSQADKADVKITYDSELYYTILKLVREDGKWKLDDVSLIDRHNQGTDYDESVYSIKAEIDKKISRIEKKKK